MGITNWAGICLSLCTGLFISANTALAQVDIEPKPDMCVEEDDTEATYEATVTTDYDFYLRLTVTLNSVTKHTSFDFVSNNGPSVVYTKTIDVSDWGMEEDDTIEYIGQAIIAEGPYRGRSDTETETDTVQASGTCLNLPGIEDSQVLPRRGLMRMVAIREETA